MVSGMVSTESLTTGVPHVTIRAIGTGSATTAMTDQRGRFDMRLPAGKYSLEAIRSGWSFKPEPLSYENPEALTIVAGACAQVQLTSAGNK